MSLIGILKAFLGLSYCSGDHFGCEGKWEETCIGWGFKYRWCGCVHVDTFFPLNPTKCEIKHKFQ